MKISKRLVALFDRVVRWSDAVATFAADYWLLLIGSFLVVGSGILKWVQFPFSHNLRGLNFPLLHDPGLTRHLSPFSIAGLGIILLGLGLVLWRRNAYLLGLIAAILITLWAITPAQIAFGQPGILRRLTYELQISPELNVFSKDYMLQNEGSPELIPKRLVLYNAWGRFSGAWAFLRLGWSLFGLGAFLVLCYALSRLPGSRLSTALLYLCLPLGALCVLLIPPAIGQHYFSRGLLAKAEARNQEAIDAFRKAMRWDAWHSHDIDLYATIGELQKQAGIDFNSPERHVSRAVALRQESNFEPAIFEFLQAAEAGGPLAATARKEAAATRVTFGLALYQAGSIGGAVTNWELALVEDPEQIYALPYLSRGYFETARYEAGIQAATRLAELIKDHNFAVANAYSTIGDCYAKLGDDIKARRYYNLSIAADPILNYWALTGLAGE